MMTLILIAIATMVAATLCVHLGLTEAIMKVAGKVATCSMCATFWATLLTLTMLYQASVLWSLLLSILAAYASHWLMLIFIYLQQKYDNLWQRLTNRQK